MQTTGYDWVLFLSRHIQITLRKAEGDSFARAQAINKAEVEANRSTRALGSTTARRQVGRPSSRPLFGGYQ